MTGEDDLALELATVRLPSELLFDLLGRYERSAAESCAAINQLPIPELADLADHARHVADVIRAELTRRTVDAAEQLTDQPE